MKSRTSELLDRSIAAMSAAIEIYNKPSFPHRLEAFTILAISGWELLLKSRWLILADRDVKSLYVYERRKNKDGSTSKKRYLKRTRSGAPLTHSIEYILRQLTSRNELPVEVRLNVEALVELRNSAVHYYSPSEQFRIRAYELAAACVKNYSASAEEWFGADLTELDIHLMPLAFLDSPMTSQAVNPRSSELKFLQYLAGIDVDDADPNSRFSVTVNVDLQFTKSKAGNALRVHTTNDPSAPKVFLTEEEIGKQYPWEYKELTSRCQRRYSDFKANQKYHDLRRNLQEDRRYAYVRELNPGHPSSGTKPFFSGNIFSECDKHYTRRKR